MNFSMTANGKYTVEQWRHLRNSRDLSAGSDSFHCSSNGQSELKVTHENAPDAPPRFKNVMQKNSRFI